MEYKNNDVGLDAFVRAMRNALEKHESEKEDSWVHCDVEFLVEKLDEEIQEYDNAKTCDDKIHELVDVANMCMMLYHRYKSRMNRNDEWLDEWKTMMCLKMARVLKGRLCCDTPDGDIRYCNDCRYI